MSEDPTTFDKDPNKTNKKKNSGNGPDFKPQKKNSKDYQVYYETKGSEKGSKDQSGSNRSNPNASHQDEPQGRKGSMNDNYSQNKSKSHAKNRKESRDQAWKKKYPKVNKEVIIELYLKASVHKDIDELVASCSQLFVKEKQIPVNKQETQLDFSEALIPKTTYTASSQHGNSTTEGNSAPNANRNGDAGASTKPLELAETSGNNPIQAMRGMMKRDKPNKEKRENEGGIFKRAEMPAVQPSTESEQKEENKDSRKESQEESQKSFDEKEKENKNQNVQPEAKTNVTSTSDPTQKESAKVEATPGPVTETNQVKEQVDEMEAQRNQNERNDANKSPTRDSGVDFSKLSFDTETKGSVSDDFGQQNDGYGGNSNKNAQQRMYQENPNANYGNAEMYQQQQNMYGGLTPQHIQQMQQQANAQYANKNYTQGASSSPTGRREGSLTSIPKVSTPPTIVFKYFSPSYEDKIWSYIDLEGKFQGPFSGRTMDDWYSKGYLPQELNVTIGNNSGFKSLKELVEIIMTHNSQSQAQGPVAKEPAPQKATPQDYQYQQQQQYYQQQQQQQQYPQQHQQQQQQQQYPQQRQYQQYQQQQQQQQQQYQQQQPQNPNQYNQQRALYHQQSNPEALRSQPEYNPYESNPQVAYTRTKSMGGGFDSNNAYYGNQGDSSQFGGQGNVIYGKVTELSNPQTYYSTPQYFNQEATQKAAQNYNTANYKAGGNVNANANAYYQEQNQYGGNTGYNQTGYNQPQKTATQYKGVTQGTAQNYPGNQMGYGANFGGQNVNTGVGRMNSGEFNMGQLSNQGNQMYGIQQQQQQKPQMMGRTPSMGNVNMGMNQNPQADMAGHLKSMLGMGRGGSRQDGGEYQ